ncbi:hypothetical protein LTR95_011601 [Oleoguttula sp. CCFEE 5521]
MAWADDVVRYQSMHAEVEEGEEEEEEDFYGEKQKGTNGDAAHDEAHAVAGAPAIEPAVTTPPNNGQRQSTFAAQAAVRNELQEREAQLTALRNKLLEKSKKKKNLNGTPTQTPIKEQVKSPPIAVQPTITEQQTPLNTVMTIPDKPSDDVMKDVTALIAEEEAAAKAKAVAAATAAQITKEQPVLPQKPVAATSRAVPHVSTSLSSRPQTVSRSSPTSAKVNGGETPTPKSTGDPRNLTDPYYDDLAIWLEFTGYHDVTHRTAKLSTYKQRREIEKEQARLAKKLAELDQAEEANIAAVRTMPAHGVAAHFTPPPLPTMLPTGLNGLSNGKRGHSPDILAPEKYPRRNEGNGFQFRGADDASRRPGSPSDRRNSFPDRRRSFEDTRARDPSLERRQRSYRDPDARGPPRQNGNWDGPRDQGRMPARQQLRDSGPLNYGTPGRAYDQYRANGGPGKGGQFRGAERRG